MKKNLAKALAVFVFLAVAITLQACFVRTGDVEEIDGGNSGGVQDSVFFTVENINFNTSFIAQEGLEKGFLIYDEIDFNSVMLDAKKVKPSSVCFDVIYGEEKITSILPDFDNKYSSFRLENKGKYTVKVFGEAPNGEEVEGSFDFGVNSSGRADRVEFVIKNSGGEIVNELKGGASYTITAQVYSDSEKVEIGSEDFFWETPSKAGLKEKSISLGNVTKNEEKNYDFYCYIRNNKNEKVNISKASYSIVDNLLKTEDFPDGVYYNYGVEKANNKLNLAVNAALDEDKYFYDNITAEYRFDNGDIQVIEKSLVSSEGKFGVFISYDGDNYLAYKKSDYDYSMDAQKRKLANYYSNGVKYQFDPTKTSAKVYLGVWEKVYNTVGYYLSPVKVNSTLVDINLVSQAPSDIKITAVIGKSKDDIAAFSKFTKEFNKAIIDGQVEVNICCDMDNDGNIRDEFEDKLLFQTYQYFQPQIEVTGGNLSDYTLEFSYQSLHSPIELIVNQNRISGDLERYFVSPNEGFATIKVKSVFSEAESEITVKVVNKIFENEKKLYNINPDSLAVFYILNLRPFVKVKEYRLSDYNVDSYLLRSLRDDEELEYYLNEVLTFPVNFTFENNGIAGQEINVKIKDRDYAIKISNVYIIPNFGFSILEENYSVANLTGTTFYGSEVSAENDSSINKYFYGLIPVMELVLEDGQSVSDGSLTLINADESYKTSYYNGVFTVKYKFSYTTQGDEYFFFAEVLKVIVK